jgi:radical SAM protein with 4Fe4S-binding SPASM domain
MYSRAYVEITNICNMRCSFCHGHSRQPRRMTREEFAHILHQLQGQTGYVYYHLMGEPLTHPSLPEFLAMAREQGFKSVITTNGTLLHKVLPALLEAGLHKLSISLHSFEQDDEETFRTYLSHVAKAAITAAEAGTVVVLRLWNKGFDKGRNDLALEFLQSAIPGQWKENTRGFRIREKFYLEWGDRFQWPDKDAPIQGECVRCYGMVDHFGILCDGTVVPCCLDSDGVIALGNVFREELSDILNSPRAQAIAAGWQRRTPSEDLCRRCGYAQRFV